MMSTKAEILEQAMTLPEEERRDLAEELMESFQLAEAEEAEALHPAWIPEIKRRVDRYLDGEAEMIEWDEAKRRILASLGES